MTRIDVDIVNFSDLIHTMNSIPLEQGQFLVSSVDKDSWNDFLITLKSGDFQKAHYTMINRFNICS